MTSAYKSESVGGCAGRLSLCACAAMWAACADLETSNQEFQPRNATQELTIAVGDGEAIAQTLLDEHSPRLDGDIIVWSRDAQDFEFFEDVVVRDGQQDRVLQFESDQVLPDASGRLVTYTDFDTMNGRVYVYDLDSTAPDKRRLVGPLTGGQSRARIDGDWVVYQDTRASNVPDVYATNLATGVETALGTSPDREVDPDVWGSWAAYRREPAQRGPAELVLVDLATGAQTVVADAAQDPQAPSLGGGSLAWVSGGGDAANIAVYDIATGQTTVLDLPGRQGAPSVDGELLVFEDDSQGGADLAAYDLRSGDYLPIVTPEAESSPHLDGNRMVYLVAAEGGGDVWARTIERFQVTTPDIQVSTSSVAFGAIDLGGSLAGSVVVSNVGDAPLVIGQIGIAPLDAPFTVAGPTTATLEPGASLQLDLVFLPLLAGDAAALLVLDSNDPDTPSVAVTLTGTGNEPEPLNPAELVREILAQYDAAVAAGYLRGIGSNNFERYLRMQAVRLMLVAARIVIDHEAPGACILLYSALRRMDGLPFPKDFVEGQAVPAIAANIRLLMVEGLSCDCD